MKKHIYLYFTYRGTANTVQIFVGVNKHGIYELPNHSRLRILRN